FVAMRRIAVLRVRSLGGKRQPLMAVSRTPLAPRHTVHPLVDLSRNWVQSLLECNTHAFGPGKRFPHGLREAEVTKIVDAKSACRNRSRPGGRSKRQNGRY